MFNFLNLNQKSLKEQLVLFGTALTILFLFPFSIYRFSIGDYSIGLVDLLMSLSLAIIFIQTANSKRAKYLNEIAVIGCMSGVAWIMSIKGLGMIFWVFPSLGVTYFVLKSKQALAINLLFIAAITLIAFDALTKEQALSIYPSLLLVCLFGFAFSLCSENQNKKLSQLVSEDVLTGVKNRRSFEEKLVETLELNKRSSIPVSLLLLDLDFFKKVNDNYGHKQGDKVLFDFAQRVKLMIRNTDFIYRIGGEEFAVIAANSKLEDATLLAETIRETIQNTPSLVKFEITVSIGVSQIKKCDDADSWFRRADLALYESKSKGRNKVYLADQDDLGKISLNCALEKKKTIDLPMAHTLQQKTQPNIQHKQHSQPSTSA